MFTLPRCPHCGMHYSYKKVVSGHMLGLRRCPHCEKEFRAKLSGGTVVLFTMLFALCLLLNVLLLRALDVDGVFIAFASLFLTLGAFALVPLTIRYKTADGKVYTASGRSLLGGVPKPAEQTPAPAHKPSKSVRRRRQKEKQQ